MTTRIHGFECTCGQTITLSVPLDVENLEIKKLNSEIKLLKEALSYSRNTLDEIGAFDLQIKAALGKADEVLK